MPTCLHRFYKQNHNLDSKSERSTIPTPPQAANRYREYTVVPREELAGRFYQLLSGHEGGKDAWSGPLWSIGVGVGSGGDSAVARGRGGVGERERGGGAGPP